MPQMPKRVKFRKAQRGVVRGRTTRKKYNGVIGVSHIRELVGAMDEKRVWSPASSVHARSPVGGPGSGGEPWRAAGLRCSARGMCRGA